MNMVHILFYAARASIALGVLFGLYWLTARKNTFYTFNRVVLLAVAALSVLVPLVSPVFNKPTTPLSPLLGHISDKVGEYFGAVRPAANNNTVLGNNNANPPVGLAAAAVAVYCLVSAFFMARLVWQVAALLFIIRDGKKERNNGYTIVHVPKKASPFSFFGFIILGAPACGQNELKHIIAHEKVHARQYHTLDILFMELFTAVFWFHPMAWKLKELAKLNLEYIADNELLKQQVNAKEYQYALLCIGLAYPLNPMVNYFNQSHLKKRIAMMNAKHTSYAAKWKYLVFMPAVIVLAIALGAVDARSQQAVLTSTADKIDTGMDVYVSISQDATGEKLETIKKYLSQEGINVSFSGVTYNSNGLLTGITISIEQPGQPASTMAVANNNLPIGGPLVFYLLRSEHGKTGLLKSYPADIPAKDVEMLKNLNGILRYNPATKDFDLHGAAQINN